MRAEAERVEAAVEAEMGRLVADGERQAEARRVVREARVVREMELGLQRGVSYYARTVAAFVLCSHLSLAYAAFAV